MSIARISGRMLKDNLERDSNLAISGNIVYVDVTNLKVGINTSAPSQTLTVTGSIGATGNVTAGNVSATGIAGTLSTAAQTSITSVGTLTALAVTGNVTSGNVAGTRGVFTNIAGTLETAAQTSITSVGTLGSLAVTGNVTAGNASATGNISASYFIGNGSQLTGLTTVGNVITLGLPSDGSISNLGAYTGWTSSTYVTEAIDDLNEMLDNVRANTFVKSVTFTSNTVAGGAGTTVTLTTVATGNSNRYDIDWGTGETATTNSSSLVPTHTYSTNTYSPFTVTVRAYNNAGSGTGSEASFTRTGYIVIYTADPVMGVELFRDSTGGTALSGSTLYVTEGDTFYLRNTTTNTTSATVAYVANFGDGVANTAIASDSASGGVSGSRLPYTYGYSKSSGTGTNTITLTLTSHTTANPASIPRATTAAIKVYDANIATPSGLSSKTITFSSTVGTSPLLAANFTDNTLGAVYTAGTSVNRTVATSGNIETVTMTSYAYDATSGYLTAFVNGAESGNITLTSSDNTGSDVSLNISAESDYQLLNAAGSSVVFADSIYSPGYFSGFKAKVSKAASGISAGVNSFQLRHSATGNSTTVEFVKDGLTSVPTMAAGTLSVGTAGTYRYISGIPYFNSGSPTVVISGATANSWIGQTYRSTSTPVTISGGTNAEGTTAASVTTTNFTYAQVDGASTFLSTGIPVAGTGQSSPYTLGNLTVSITNSVRTIEQIGISAINVNGSSAVAENATKLAVHSTAQSGISEIAVTVATSSFGDGTYTDSGKRSVAFLANTTDTPAYNGATNFYTTSLYSESSDPGVAGTKEATVRLGVIKYDATNYSTGYLPAGPNRSADTGTQYFTFAFRRRSVANFDINITTNGATAGVAGVWIAAPGTTIDGYSGYNGWLLASTTKAASGVPGSLSGGNGSDGCAANSGDRIAANTSLSGGYTMSLGEENMSNATGNVVLVRIGLASGQSISTLSIGAAA